MRLTLVRHGETSGESSIRYYGATDVPLSALGVEQMRCAGAALARERFDALFCSRLRRAREGAWLVARGALEPTLVAAFDEVDFGRWEGWTREEIAARDPEQFRLWQQAPETFAYPEGECRRAFQRRVVDGLRAVLAGDPGRNVLMVVHRGVIAVMLAELLRLGDAERRRLEIDLASIHVVRRAGDGWRAEALNRVDHLSPVQAPPAGRAAGDSARPAPRAGDRPTVEET